MAGVARRSAGPAVTVQLDGHGSPQQVVAVEVLVDRRKAAVDDPDAADGCRRCEYARWRRSTVRGRGSRGFFTEHRDVPLRAESTISPWRKLATVRSADQTGRYRLSALRRRCSRVATSVLAVAHARFRYALQPCDARRATLRILTSAVRVSTASAVDVKATAASARAHSITQPILRFQHYGTYVNPKGRGSTKGNDRI